MITLFILAVVLILLIQYISLLFLIVNQIIENKYELIIGFVPIIGLIIAIIISIHTIWISRIETKDLFKKGLKNINNGQNFTESNSE